jgi:hypothetical protein
MGDFLLSWLLVPALLCVLSLGCGLLVAWLASRTVTRSRPGAEPFPGALVLPVGFAATVVVASLLTTWNATAPLAGVGPLAVAIAGLVVGRPRLRAWWADRRRALAPFVAAGIPWAAVALPVVLTGKPGFTGFAKIVDLAHQIAFVEWLRTEGRTQVSVPNSSYQEIVDKLVSSSYPGGTQSVVASMGDLAHLNVMWAYQPVLAFVAAMLGLTLYVVLRHALPRPPVRALAAAVAAQPTILYSYTLVAGIKELSGAGALLLVAAVFARQRPEGWSVVIPGAVAIASAYSIFNLTIAPWLGVMVAALIATELLRERTISRVALRWASVVGLTLLLAAPAVANGFTLLRAAGGANGPEGLGNLAAAVPAWSSFGPWITADHRFPLAQYGHPTATYILIGIAIALIVVGVYAAIRARDRGLGVLALAGVVAVAFFMRDSGVWLQLKAFCMTAPIALALAFAGAAWLARRARPLQVLGVAAAVAVALGVLYGNALQYHHTTLADYDRLTDLQRIDARYAGQGPALFTNFDEYGEYLLRDVRASGLVNPWRSLVTYNRTAIPGLQMVRDTDEYEQHFLQGFRLIIRRRDPRASRPPSNWRLDAVTREYEIWRRVGAPSRIAAHFPLQARPGERRGKFCARVQASVARVGAGARIAYAVPKKDLVAVIADPRAVPRYWGRLGDDLRAGTPGHWRQRFALPATGSYNVFLRGSVGRRVKISVDGRQIAAPRWRESYPGQSMLLATMRLARGTHQLDVVRGGGSLLPGTGNDAGGTTTAIGPVVFDPTSEQEVVRSAPASRLESVCGSQQVLDWLEVWRPNRRSS